MENWLSIAAGVYLLSMVLYGHYRGFIRLAVSMVALVAALAIVHVSMPKVTEYLKENTSIQQTLSNSMKQAAGIGDEEEKDEDVPSVQRTIIENLNLPQNVKSALIENNNHEVYEFLGVNAFADYIGNYLADMILNSVGFVLMFAIVYLLIKLVVRWLDLIARLPILSGMNKIAGALLGGVQGLIFLWILCLVLTACSGTSWGMTLIHQVEASKWLSFLYEHNFLNAIVLSVIHGML